MSAAAGTGSRLTARRPGARRAHDARRRPSARRAEPPALAFVTLGCPKNTVDSEHMLGLLVRDGFRTVADVAAADVALRRPTLDEVFLRITGDRRERQVA